MHFTYIVVSLLSALTAARLEIGGHGLCITGCCGFNLDVQSAELISSNAVSKLPVGHAIIPCCNCTASGATVGKAGSGFGGDETLLNIGAMHQKPLVNILGQSGKAMQDALNLNVAPSSTDDTDSNVISPSSPDLDDPTTSSTHTSGSDSLGSDTLATSTSGDGLLVTLLFKENAAMCAKYCGCGSNGRVMDSKVQAVLLANGMGDTYCCDRDGC